MSNTVKQGQSFLDKATELTGSYENALAMAIINDRSITDTLPIGEDVQASAVTNKLVVAFFNPNNEPATAATKAQLEDIEHIGIGKMIVGSTFIVG